VSGVAVNLKKDVIVAAVTLAVTTERDGTIEG
jgi:hypothetical protein